MTVRHLLHQPSRRSRTAALFGVAALAVAMTLGTAVGTASADTVLTPPIDVGTENWYGTAAYGVAITPNGQYAYVTNYGDSTISVIDTSDNTVVAALADTAVNQPSAVAITPDGKHVYVTNQWGRDTVSVIDTALGDTPNTVTSNVAVGANPTAVAITPDGKYAYVASSGSSTVSVINTETDPQPSSPPSPTPSTRRVMWRSPPTDNASTSLTATERRPSSTLRSTPSASPPTPSSAPSLSVPLRSGSRSPPTGSTPTSPTTAAARCPSSRSATTLSRP
nr:YncE family protein [Rhodococcus sp. OK302]